MTLSVILVWAYQRLGLLYENDKGEYVVLNDVRMADIRLASAR